MYLEELKEKLENEYKEQNLKIGKILEKIKQKYDILPDIFYELEDAYLKGYVRIYEDLNEFFYDYITEEDEFLLGPINLCKKIEDRDFVKRIIKEESEVLNEQLREYKINVNRRND